MMVQISVLAVAAGLLSSQSLVSAINPSEIPDDVPVSSLLNSANNHLAMGQTSDALTYYDVAISRDPTNYLTFFKRGATYLSLGRTTQAQSDFDKVLTIKPGFEGALIQRAKIKSKSGNWDAAKEDYLAAGHTGPEVTELEEAEGASKLAVDAEKRGDYEECITQAGVAIMVANKNLSLRKLRVRCRFERGEVQEGISDLAHVLQMQPGDTDPHLQISSVLFYSLADTERGMAQIRKCLHSDPDSKSCTKLYRRQKQINKQLLKIRKLFEKKSYSTAAKYLAGSGEDIGLIQEIKEEVAELRAANTIPAKAPSNLYTEMVEMACEAYSEVKSKKAPIYCTEALELNPHSLHGLLAKAQQSSDEENYEACINTLNLANEHHPGNQHIQSKLQAAQIALKRSKEKDYYKVLGLPKDADELQIKSAYRRKTREHHPDKAVRNGVTKEDAEKRMASINEAYEVLSDPELKARFDRGDDPNSHERQGNPFQHGNPFGGQQFFHQQGGSRGGGQFHFQNGFPFG
ncbi:hypothetical protein V491_07327 [Pseudogymnoascus sp. VKM F-3775]|nr:hypothetical protein V491_07327 [Pseudogymnoascus sp. VKM F-3775]